MTFPKLVEKVKFSERKLKKGTALKSKKVKGIFEKMFILALLSSPVFHLQNRVSDFF